MTIAKIGNTVYPSMAAAATAVVDGQTIQVVRSGAGPEVTAPFVKAGTYKILGVPDAKGALPKLQIDMYTRPAFGKAIINLEDGNYEIGFLHMDGCAVPDSNGAAIRINPTTDQVHIHHVRLSNNENGILTSEGGAKLYISDSALETNGKSMDSGRRGYSHNIYVGAIARIECTRVSFLNSVYGHDFKSRALVTVLNQVLCEGAAEGRAVDIPNGGVLLATDCKFAKAAGAKQNNLVDIGAEGITAGREERYEFVNCHFHNDVAPGRDVQYIMNRSKKEVVLVDPLFTGAAAEKDRKATLVGNIRIVLTGGPLGPRKTAGGDPGSTSTMPVPTPAPADPAPVTPPAPANPAPGTPPAPANPAPTIPAAPQIPGVDTAAWTNLLAALIGNAKQNTTLVVQVKANPNTGLTAVAASISHPAT